MRILVTRPEREAQRTAARLTALGHEVVCAPLLEIVATGFALPFGPYDAILARGTQRVTLFGADSARLIHDLPLFAVGERTAAAAHAASFCNVRPAAPDARELTEKIVDCYQKPASLLYLAGRDRKRELETA